MALSALRSGVQTTSAKYDLLAIDLDGTLLGSNHDVSKANIAALERARSAGLRISICTGRGFRECRHITDLIGPTEAAVVAGGAIIADPVSGKTINRFTMPESLVGDLVDVLVRNDHAALVLKDPAGTSPCGVEPGHDYVVVSPLGADAIDPVTKWWFDMLSISYRCVGHIREDEHPTHSVRVGVCGTRRETRAAAQEFRERFGDRITLHHFGAVAPALSPDPEDGIVILEAFDKVVNKWTAVQWLAERDGIQPARIAAIGNDINDIALLSGAGLGIAMGNAIPECKAVADRHTVGHDADGVAHAIDLILDGHW